MLGRWTKGLLHLLVGGACAALVVWLAFGFSTTVIHTHGPVRWLMAALVGLSILVALALLLAPPVRAAEVALATALLDVRLDPPADQTSWESRRRGLLWAVAVLVLGGTSLLALLWCVPQGLWLVVAAVDADTADSLPSMLTNLPALLLATLGMGLLLVGTLGQGVLVTGLRWLAPRVLGPTPMDRLAQAEEEHARLLRSHELARELHDSIGHALTAIGVQAEAGARVAQRDPNFAHQALGRIAATSQSALAELDQVLGSLRAGSGTAAPPDPGTSLCSLIELLGELGPRGSGAISCPEHPGEVDPEAGRTAYRVVQEALTNVHRHGTGQARGRIGVHNGQIQIRIENPVGEPSDGSGGRGLLGMRERLTLAGGGLTTGVVTIEDQGWWRLEAWLPARSDR